MQNDTIIPMTSKARYTQRTPAIYDIPVEANRLEVFRNQDGTAFRFVWYKDCDVVETQHIIYSPLNRIYAPHRPEFNTEYIYKKIVPKVVFEWESITETNDSVQVYVAPDVLTNA